MRIAGYLPGGRYSKYRLPYPARLYVVVCIPEMMEKVSAHGMGGHLHIHPYAWFLSLLYPFIYGRSDCSGNGDPGR